MFFLFFLVFRIQILLVFESHLFFHVFAVSPGSAVSPMSPLSRLTPIWGQLFGESFLWFLKHSNAFKLQQSHSFLLIFPTGVDVEAGSCLDVGMSGKLGNGSQIHPFFQQSGAKGMSKFVGVQDHS